MAQMVLNANSLQCMNRAGHSDPTARQPHGAPSSASPRGCQRVAEEVARRMDLPQVNPGLYVFSPDIVRTARLKPDYSRLLPVTRLKICRGHRWWTRAP